MRGEIAVQGRPAAGVGRIQQEIFEIHRDELDWARQFVAVRAAVAERVVRGAKAEPHRADLPAGKVEQARIARQLALRRAVVEMRQFVDDGGERRARGRILDAGVLRARHPAVEQRCGSAAAAAPVHGRGPPRADRHAIPRRFAGPARPPRRRAGAGRRQPAVAAWPRPGPVSAKRSTGCSCSAACADPVQASRHSVGHGHAVRRRRPRLTTPGSPAPAACRWRAVRPHCAHADAAAPPRAGRRGCVRRWRRSWRRHRGPAAPPCRCLTSCRMRPTNRRPSCRPRWPRSCRRRPGRSRHASRVKIRIDRIMGDTSSMEWKLTCRCRRWRRPRRAARRSRPRP